MTEIISAHGVRRSEPEPAFTAGTGRAVLLGTVLGFFVVGGLCGGVAALVGLPPAAAVALGAFTGLWGGPGFGGMLGFVLHQSKTGSDTSSEHGPQRSA